MTVQFGSVLGEIKSLIRKGGIKNLNADRTFFTQRRWLAEHMMGANGGVSRPLIYGTEARES